MSQRHSLGCNQIRKATLSLGMMPQGAATLEARDVGLELDQEKTPSP